MLQDNKEEKWEEKSSRSIIEDPTRKVYKQALTTLFLITNTLSLLAHIISEIQSGVMLSFLTSYTFLDEKYLTETQLETALNISLTVLTYSQCVANPLIFLCCEFFI